ncbi:hypothetical protein JHW45_09090 [Paracoccus stylophorae]|uniref:Uncharacterized protein n=1 Tax=Paracoccus stylophorae TaxID=659350 RepID=A0ABY7SR15_9RHOB|nr:hypothetical protein [Paracoccus stylophorae]WCR09289.1 hypothetical protein JHW45_09090 [Paracoccus stylophorae]
MRAMILVVLMLLPAQASAFLARNGMTAHGSGPADIVVDYRAGRLDTDYWCAAGDYARRVLGLAGDTRLWRASPKPRGAGQGIVFTLDETRKADGAGLSHFGAGPRDGSISVGMAVGSYCRLIVPFWPD